MEVMNKEIQIYTAVFELAKKGKDLNSLKVSEIADEANMGKGTLYEYFNSKEEILSKTIEHFFLLEVANVLQLLDGKELFINKIEKIMWSIVEGKEKYTPLEVIITNSSKYNSCIMDTSKEKFDSMMNQVNSIFDCLIELGVKESVFDKNADEEYLRFKLLSSFSGFMLSAKQSDNPMSDESVRNALRYAIKLIVS